MRGEPIVCSAVDAILCFVSCHIDVLVVEDFAMERSSIPPLWELQAWSDQKGSGEGIGHRVYTML